MPCLLEKSESITLLLMHLDIFSLFKGSQQCLALVSGISLKSSLERERSLTRLLDILFILGM